MDLCACVSLGGAAALFFFVVKDLVIFFLGGTKVHLLPSWIRFREEEREAQHGFITHTADRCGHG